MVTVSGNHHSLQSHFKGIDAIGMIMVACMVLNMLFSLIWLLLDGPTAVCFFGLFVSAYGTYATIIYSHHPHHPSNKAQFMAFALLSIFSLLYVAVTAMTFLSPGDLCLTYVEDDACLKHNPCQSGQAGSSPAACRVSFTYKTWAAENVKAAGRVNGYTMKCAGLTAAEGYDSAHTRAICR